MIRPVPNDRAQPLQIAGVLTEAPPPDSSPSRPTHHTTLPAIILLIAATLITYYPATKGTFIWDDDGHVTRPALRSIQGLGDIWAHPSATQQYYPLLHSAFWLEWQFFADARAAITSSTSCCTPPSPA